MITEHPITPPPELTDVWKNLPLSDEEIFVIAARWGADQELEACLDQLRRWGIQGVENLRNTRRPKPPSLAEAALEVVTSLRAGKCVHRNGDRMNVLTAALERLQQLEQENND